MKEKIVLFLTGTFGAITGKIIGVFIISMIPIIELRGAIPVAFAIGLDWKIAMVVSIIGNLLPIPFILLFLDFLFNFMKKHNILKRLVLWSEEKAHKNAPKVEKYGFLGLMIFTAIPLPGTGAWTGALIASVMKMNRKKSIVSIILGVLIASTVVTIITYGLIGSIIS